MSQLTSCRVAMPAMVAASLHSAPAEGDYPHL
jgi:hypothetical protein